MSRRARTPVPAILALLGIASSSLAAEPSLLGPQAIPQDILRCDRQYEYRHRRLSCDSPLAADGEGLRPLLDSVPAAREELDLYQSHRRSLDVTAYTGMAGFMLAIFGPRFLGERAPKNTTITIGLSLALGSLAVGRSRLLANETHLDRAVRHFNDANPGDPITLLPPGASTPPEPAR
jgi:hypothetical protein